MVESCPHKVSPGAYKGDAMPKKLDYKKMLLEDFEPLSDDNKWKAILYVETLHNSRETRA